MYTDFPLYPTEVFNGTDYPDQVDNTDIVYAALINALKSEMQACFDELGVLPKTKFNDVNARMYAIEIAAGMRSADPISQWKMNDDAASAVVIDSVGSNNGTYKDTSGNINTSTGSVTGKVNEALDFDGDEYVDCGNPTNLQISTNLSVFCWIKYTSGYNAIGKSNSDGGTNFGWILDIRNNHVYPVFKSSNGTIYENAEGSTALNDGEWHHIGMVYDGNSLKAYVDGAVDGEDTAATGTIRGYADYILGIGTCPSAGTLSHITAKIDEVRIYNFTVLLAGVEGLYNLGHGTEEKNPYD